MSDTTWFTKRALTYLKGAEHRHWFLHLGYYRPHPPFIAPEPYNALYDPAEMLPPCRAASPGKEAEQHPLLRYYVEHIPQNSFFQDGLGLVAEMSVAEVKRMRCSSISPMTRASFGTARTIQPVRPSSATMRGGCCHGGCFTPRRL